MNFKLQCDMLNKVYITNFRSIINRFIPKRQGCPGPNPHQKKSYYNCIKLNVAFAPG